MPPRAKVDVGRVRQLVAEGVAHRDVAERLGVSRSVVSRVAMGIYPERVCNRCNVRRSTTEPRCPACGGVELPAVELRYGGGAFFVDARRMIGQAAGHVAGE